MPRTIAAFVRHGEYAQKKNTPSAHQPFALTRQGIETAQREADEFVTYATGRNWVLAPRIDSSNMLRAWQTAEIFARCCHPVESADECIDSFDALAERGVGSVANLSIREIEEIVNDDPRFEPLPEGWKSNSHYRLPFQGAESLMQAGLRVAAHVEHQMKRLRSETTIDTVKLFVGHGAAFRHAACHFKVLAFDDLAKYSMFHARPVFIEYLSSGSWRHVGGDWKLRESGNGMD